MKRRPDLSGDRWERIRRRILDRDRWRCTDCGRAGRLEIHHEVSPLESPALAHEGGNLRTLCVDCHLNLHGRKAPDPEVLAWQEFVRLPNHRRGSVNIMREKDTRGV